MRLLVHDFAGHPFQVQLSRELAVRGHRVTHAYPAGLDGPKGRLEKSVGDSELLTVQPVPLSATFRKYSAWRRFATQRQYASDLQLLIDRERPDVVLSGNTPIDVQAQLLWHCRGNDIGFVHWVQDVYCQAIEFFLRNKLGGLAAPLSLPFRMLEKKVSSASDAVVVIAPAFRDLLINWGVPVSKIQVIENWAPLEEMPPRSRRNPWSEGHMLSAKTVFLYSGTLGLKHRPDLLYKLAQSLDDNCQVVVISEGVGRDYLENLPPRKNLLLLNFQPYDKLPDALATADVLLATLEKDAGEFAVPSKILSYLCAGRPILLSAPRTNLAASVIDRSGGGLVVDPDDPSAWLDSAKRLASRADLRLSFSQKARKYAEQTFDIKKIASAFEAVVAGIHGRHSAVDPSFEEVPIQAQS
jgi:glycosyltransferase involved in cell wall biosynthesis